MIEYDDTAIHPHSRGHEYAWICDRGEEFVWVWFPARQELWVYPSGVPGEDVGAARLIASGPAASKQYYALDSSPIQG